MFWCLQLLERRNALLEHSQTRHMQLEESYKLQMFERDCDETKIWINEKLKAASDEGYLVSGVTKWVFTYVAGYLLVQITRRKIMTTRQSLTTGPRLCFHHNARLTSWRTLMAYFVQSRNGEESLNKCLSPGPDPDPDNLRRGPSHGIILLL